MKAAALGRIRQLCVELAETIELGDYAAPAQVRDRLLLFSGYSIFLITAPP